MAAEHRIAKSLRAATTFRRRRSEFTPYLHHEQVEPWFDTRIPIKPGELATENLSSARLILLAHGYSLRGVRQPQLWFIDAAYGFGLFRQQPCAARTNLECIHILKGTEDFSDGKSADCRSLGILARHADESDVAELMSVCVLWIFVYSARIILPILILFLNNLSNWQS